MADLSSLYENNNIGDVIMSNSDAMATAIDGVSNLWAEDNIDRRTQLLRVAPTMKEPTNDGKCSQQHDRRRPTVKSNVVIKISGSSSVRTEGTIDNNRTQSLQRVPIVHESPNARSEEVASLSSDVYGHLTVER